MLSKSSKWELSFVHYIKKFTISSFVISRFECTSTYFLHHLQLHRIFMKCTLSTKLNLPGSINKNPRQFGKMLYYTQLCTITM